MAKKAVLIGAGQIGRGFIGQVLCEAGYALTFVDASQALVDDINRYRQYKVIVMGAGEQEYVIDNISACLPDTEQAVAALCEASLVTTAVGPTALAKTATTIAAGIVRRMERGSTEPMTVIACENMEFGSSQLFESVKEHLSAEQLDYCAQYVGFPDAEVSRMVMPIEDENPLTVKVEQYKEWVVDSAKVKGDLSGIRGIELSDNPTAFIKRKMFTLTGHAMLGYLGYRKGLRYIYEAAYDDEIFHTVFQALTECGKGWCGEYNMPAENFDEYICIMMRRFADTRMVDPCVRPCRQPMRKLSQGERFIEPALTALKHGIEPAGIVAGIRAVLDYDYAEDEQAVELQRRIAADGLPAVLEQVCGLQPGERLTQMILNA